MSRLKRIVIADDVTSEVLEILYTDEEVIAIKDTLAGNGNPYGISVFDDKDEYRAANSGADAT